MATQGEDPRAGKVPNTPYTNGATEAQATALTTIEAFDPSFSDIIEEIPLGPKQVLRLRLVALPETVTSALDATRRVLIRNLRTQFLQEAEDGRRRIPMEDDFREIEASYELYARLELKTAFERLWHLATPEVLDDNEDAPEKLPFPEGYPDDWADERLRKEILRLLLVEMLLQTETQAIRETAQQMLIADIGQTTPAEELDPEALRKRSEEVMRRELNARRLQLREIDEELLWKRLRFAGAMEPAITIGSDRALALILYAAARDLNDRSRYFFDLSDAGIHNVVDALRDPQKAWDAMLAKFRGDEALLIRVARSVAGFAGLISQEMRDRVQKAAENPFRAESLFAGEEAGENPRVGAVPADGGARADDGIGQESVVPKRRGGDTASDNIDEVPKTTSMGDRELLQ